MIAPEAERVDVTLKDFLAPYRPEKVELKDITDAVGQTATLDAIITQTFRGSDGGKDLLRSAFPDGDNFNRIIETVEDGEQKDISQFANKLYPNTDEQLETKAALEALGIEFSSSSIPDQFSFSKINSDPFIADIVSATNFQPSVPIQDLVNDTSFEPSEVVRFSDGPTAEQLAELADEDGNLQQTAKLKDILRVAAPGKVSLEELLEGVLEPKDEESLARLRESIPDGEEVDISQTIDKSYEGATDEEVLVASTIPKLYGVDPSKQLPRISDDRRNFLNYVDNATNRIRTSIEAIENPNNVELQSTVENNEGVVFTRDDGNVVATDPFGRINILETSRLSGSYDLGGADDVAFVRRAPLAVLTAGEGSDNVTALVGGGIVNPGGQDVGWSAEGRIVGEGIADGEVRVLDLNVAFIDFQEQVDKPDNLSLQVVDNLLNRASAIAYVPVLNPKDTITLAGTPQDYLIQGFTSEDGNKRTLISARNIFSTEATFETDINGSPIQLDDIEIPKVGIGSRTIAIIEEDLIGRGGGEPSQIIFTGDQPLQSPF